MNKLLTNINGGFPFVLDDIRWIDNAYRDALTGIMNAFNIPVNGRYIISGCEITQTGSPVPTHYNISAGHIYYDGEIYVVDAHSIQILFGTNGEQYYWTIDVSYDAAGNKTFEDGAQHDTYEVSKAKVVFGIPPTNYMPMAAPRLIDMIADYAANHLTDYLEDVRLVGQQGQPAFNFGWNNYSGQEPVGFYKDLQSSVVLQGRAVRSFGQNYIFTLPSGYRPSKNRWFITNGEDWNGTTIALSTTILTNGNILVNNITNNNQVRAASLEGVRFRI